MSPKTVVRESGIEGRGLHAAQQIMKGDVVGIKGGHIFDRATLHRVKDDVGDSYFQVHDNFFVGPMTKEEVSESMIYLNHSCEPNAGVEGNIVFVAMRDIAAGEEVTIDYVMTDGDDFSFACGCRSPRCRKVVTGDDWKNKDLQRRYAGYFSSYIQNRINREVAE